MVYSVNSLEDLIVSELSEGAGLEAVILYGSRALGLAREDSDVDIAVLYDKKLDYHSKTSLISRLEDVLKTKVDLVDLYPLHGIILKQILIHGKILLGRESGAIEKLLSRMVYDQEDMMPYYTRGLEERRMRFLNG